MTATYELTSERLRRFDVFEGFDLAELAYIVELIELRCFAPDETIIREGERSRNMYLLGQGEAGVFKSLEPESEDDRRLATLEAPAVFGEVGFVLGEPRTATIRADCFSHVCALDGHAFDTLRAERLELAHALVLNILSIVSRRQAKVDRELLAAMEQTPEREAREEPPEVGEQLMRRWTLD
jgi:CRP-like cAMP-binding protein